MDRIDKIAGPLGEAAGEPATNSQQLIDLYGAAAYWIYHSNANGNFRHSARRSYVSHIAAYNLSTALRELALTIGVSAEQLDKAEQDARDCLGRGAAPMLARSSFDEFRGAVMSAWPEGYDKPSAR